MTTARRQIVLIVDDTATMRVLERAALGPCYDYAEAKNGAEALEQVARQKPDLILLDITMPVLDGIATLRALKQQADTAGIPVIMVTTEREVQKRMDCESLGCADFLQKPVSPAVLREAVRRCLLAG